MNVTTTDVIIDEGFNQEPVDDGVVSWFKKMISKLVFHIGKLLLKFGIKIGIV
ncbi:MAG: hypothetical protein NC177_17020 [Ruminococcus flavefaciens]|nr:hypothetical protein [Ruminococcus flavefaciens]